MFCIRLFLGWRSHRFDMVVDNALRSKAMAKHLSLPRVAECSMHPKYKCNKCGEILWTERSIRSGGQEWLITKDGKRHYKTRCKTVSLNKEIDGKPRK